MFENLRNMAGLLGQAKELKARFEQAQAELGRRTVEGDSGAGAVRVVINGRLEVISVRLDKPLLATLAGEGDAQDQQMIEDLIAAAFNAAMVKAQELIRQEMSKVTGGLNLPGMDQLPGM
jgi:nucleoid-associated protein EbfC